MKKKKQIRTSWAGQYADKSDYLKQMDAFDYQHKLDQAAILESENRSRSALQRAIDADIEYQNWQRSLDEGSDEHSYTPQSIQDWDQFGQTVENYNKENTPKKNWYTENWWNHHGRQMNDFQIGDFQGYIDRTKQWQRLAEGISASWDIEDRVNQINKEIESLRQQTATDSFGTIDINQKIQDLLYEKKQLMSQYEQLKPVREAFDSYIPSGLKSRYYDLVSGNANEGGIQNIFSNNPIFGRTSQLHDETGDFLRFTSSLYTPGITRERQRQLLKAAIDTSNEKIKEWQNGIDLNIKDRESYGKVDPWYEMKAKNAGTDIFNWDTWAYGMSGLIAGSTSGMSKILPAMLLGIATSGAATAAGAAYGALAGAATTAAGFAGTAALNYGAGVAENNAEIANAYKERIEDYLKSQKGEKGTLYDDVIAEGRKKLGNYKLTDDQVFEQFRRGSYTTNNVAVNRKLTKLARGIENQHQDDMAATTYGSLFESALEVLPFGKVISAPRALRYAMLRSQKGRKFMRSSALNNVAEGFAVGSTVNPIVGAAYAPLHTIVRPILNKAGRFGAEAVNNIAKATRISELIPEQTFTRKFFTEPRKRLIKDISGRWILSSIEEGVEEGKQHISANKYKNNEYTTDKIKSFGETILDDLLAGSKSAGLLLGMPFEGMMSEEDREILKEIKGGFILGGLQTAIVNAASQYYPYKSEMSARDAIVNTVLTDKAAKADALKKGQVYAEAAKTGSSYQHIKDAFNVLREKNEEENRTSGQYGVDPKHIDEEEQEFERIAKMANDGYTIKQAESQGIQRGTEEYNKFVAHKALAEQQLKDEQDVLKTARDNYNAANDDVANSLLTAEMQKMSSIIPGQEQQESEPSASNLTQSFDTYFRTRTLAEYTAMLKRKEELELGIENAVRSGNKQIEKIIQQQLNSINARIKVNRPAIAKLVNAPESANLDTVEDVEQNYVLDKTNHDTLTDLYRQVLLATDDFELAKNQYESIVGKAYLDDKEITPDTKFDANADFDRITYKGGKAKDIIAQTEETLQDDDDFMSVVQEDFDERTDDEGNEIITPEEKEEIQEEAPANNPEEEFKEEVMQASKKPYVSPSIEVREQQPKEVENKPTEVIQSPSEPISPAQPIVNPETPETQSEQPKTSLQKLVEAGLAMPDDAGYMLHKRNKDVSEGRMDDLEAKRALLTIKSALEKPDMTWQRLHDILVNAGYVMTVNGLTYLKNSMLAIQAGKVSAEDVVALIHPNTYFKGEIKTSEAVETIQNTKSQQNILDQLKAKAEASKEYVIKVDKESYIIKIGDQQVKMPRVHSVMPKYWYGDGSYAAALQLGNAFDNLARMFFGDINNIALYEQNKDAFVESWFDRQSSEDPDNPNKVDKTYRELYRSKEAFANTINDLYELAKQYRDLGWALSTDKIVWYSKFASGYVAGETDMIAVDRDGNIHIIDFKTAKGTKPFQTFVNDDVYRTTKYADLLNTLTEDDFKAGPNKKGLSKAAKAVKRQIREAEGPKGKPNRNIMLEWQDNKAVVKYADSEFSNVPARMQSYRKGPKSAEYSDQLTAYAEMIQKQLANVIDLEVVGFRTQYTADDKTNLVQIQSLENQVNGKPFRIKVSFSDEMRGILNTEAPAVSPVDKPNAEAVEAKQNNQADLQAQNQEAAAKDKYVPSKSEDSIKKPNEPDTSRQKNLGFSNLNEQAIERNPELAKLTASPDFVNECIQKGLIEVYTEDVKERSGTNNYVYVDISYNRKTYKRIYVWANPALHNRVKELEKNKKPGQKIVVTSLKRTAGKIQARKNGASVSLTETPLLAGVNLQDIEITPAFGRIGIVKDGSVIAYEGGDVTQPRPIGTLNKPNGTIVFVKNVNHKENQLDEVPVTIARKTFKDSADFIIECLRNIDTINDQYITTINGKQVAIGATKKQLLSLLMPIVTNVDDAAAYSILRDTQNPSTFYVVVRTSNQPVFTVNMLDPQSVASFKQFLSQTDIPLHNRVMVSRIGNSTNKTPSVFVNIKKFFGQNADVQSLVVTPDIKFDRSDILGEGLSGLGWYIKNGRLITDFEDIVAPLVSIGDVGYFDDTKDESPIDQVKTIEEQIPEQVKDNDELDIEFFMPDLQKRMEKGDESKPKLTPEQIKKNLRPILGDEVDDPTVIQLITTLSVDPRFENAAVVGLAHADGIKIYKAAFEGVDYHEAFHRIFELFVDPKQRDKVYNTVAKELGLDLSKDSEENNWTRHRLVAEHVADAYMDYKGREFNTRFNWLNRILNKIRDIVNALFHISDRQLYKIFMDVNSGKYRSERRKSDYTAQKERFEKMFGELNYEVHGQEFKHLINDPMYEDAKNTAFYCMMLGQQIDLSGKNVSSTKINRKTFMRGADRLAKLGYDIFGTTVDPEDKTPGQLVMSELYSKFEAVSDDIASMFAAVSTDYKKVRQDETQEDLDGDEESIASAWDENFFKWDYEFSRFDKTSSRVKYFFASIPDMKYDESGRMVLQRNSLGMPQMLPMKYVFNEVLSALWDIDTLDELIGRVKDLAKEDPMWLVISKNLDKIIKTRENDADKEALLTQLMNTIRSNRHTFMLAKAVANAEGVYTINMQTSDADYNAREYPIQWSQVLSKGGSDVLKVNENGQLVFNPKNPDAAITFQKISRLFDFSRQAEDVEYVGLKQMLSEAPSKKPKVMVLWDITGTEEYQFLEYSDDKLSGAQQKAKRVFINRKATNLNDPAQLRKVKDKIVEALNAIGINMHIEEFDYMLKHKYGSTDVDALRQMVNSTDETDSMSSFLYFLNTISNGKSLNIQADGSVFLKSGKRVPFENVYENLAFVRELGNWKYQYRHSRDELTVLATGGNKFYEMSDNDLFSDTLRALNKRGQWFEDLKQDPYNYTVSSEKDANGEYQTYGSYTLDQLVKDPNLKIQLRHLIGFKTDKKGDQGQDYFEISRREDYLSKVQILESGGILSLTLSDKKKYVYIQGIKLPGLDYSNVLDSEGNPIPDAANAIQKTHSPKDGGIDQLDSVVTQFLSYAKSEYESIKSVAEKNINVKNFKEQGKRFSSLLGVWEDVYDKDGKWTGEQFISFNDNKKSWEENLGIAEAYFFDRSEDEQKALIKRNLNKILDKELATAESLGLIKRSGSNENVYLNYKNVGLNSVAIKSLATAYTNKYPGCAPEVAESIAVVVYLNDISNKAIMSGQEMERLMSGNPAFYKWKYNDRGELVDRTVDELKRLGGLGSTGTNNFLELSNLPEKYKGGKYRCAEVDNEEVASPQLEMLKSTMYAGELRQNVIYDKLAKEEAHLRQQYEFDVSRVYKDKEMDEDEKSIAFKELKDALKSDLQAARERITQEVDNSSIEQLESDYEGSEVLKLSKEKAEVASKSYAGKIDVADGGAYITDEMCETLLRMEGSWSKEIEEAFDILRGRKKADYLGKSEAYQKVLTTVIGNQKYTAFGRRLQNGVSVPYYHKMALFPIFECIATGKMSNIFDKMKEQGIDMLLINSAVKVGSQGSKPINWSEFREDSDEQNANNFFEDGMNGLSWKPTFKESFNFNTYDVDFTYLRKQLNTDPNEEEMLRMGTQAQKIVFSNLFQGRMYEQQSGQKILGADLQDRIMKSLNALSDMGVKKLNKRFFVTDENGQPLDKNGNVLTDPNSNERQLDIEKFAKEVSRLMSDRGADKNVMKALEVVSNSTDGKHLTIPLGAISNASWLESVLISTINKEVVDVNTPGAFFIQRSIWAMQGKRMYSKDKGNILGRQIYNGQRLQMINEEGSMDCVLSLDYFEHILPEVWSGEYETDENGDYIYERVNGGTLKKKLYQDIKTLPKPNIKELVDYALENGASVEEAKSVTYILNLDFRLRTEQQNAYIDKFKDTWTDRYLKDKYSDFVPKRKMRKMSFDEARQWLLDNGVIGGKANIMAYRIPTQAESSIHALRCVDVLPVVRDTVILPEEFTKITGSDFDIDKLGLSTINWNVENGKASDKFEEGSEKYYQNQIIRDFITLLIDKNTPNILHRSIDNDTKLLTDIVEELEGGEAVREEPYGFYSLSTQTERKNDYITGKIGIGPFALNNNNHILTMLYGVRFKDFPGSVVSTLGLTNLGTREDADHNSIMSWISALINAHVDIAKDPYISKLNVNPYTYNLVNTLIRTGFGRNTFYFTTQPIMKELAVAYMNASSSYMADQNKTQYQLQRDAVEEVAKNRFGDLELGEYKFEDFEGINEPKNIGMRTFINDMFKQIVDNGTLRKNANGKDIQDGMSTTVQVGEETIKLSSEQIQFIVYLVNEQLAPYAQSVSNLVKYSKIDTKKHGKSYIEQQLFEEGFDDLFFNPDGSGLFEEDGIRDMVRDSYILTKTRNAISMTKNVLKGQFLQATNAFDKATSDVLREIGRPNSKSADLNSKIVRAIMASVKSEFINNYAKELHPDNPTFIRDLVSESREEFEGMQAAGHKEISIRGKSNYSLTSYIGGTVTITFNSEKSDKLKPGMVLPGGVVVISVVQNQNDATYTFRCPIIGANDELNQITVPMVRKKDMQNGKIVLSGGKNTIFDRFNRLAVQLKDNPQYSDILDMSGEPINMLLRSLVRGKTFNYVAPSNNYLQEVQDTYETLKFLKLFNALDQNGVESNYIIDAWDELLHDDKHPLLKEFAEDLVVYAFVTSGDQGGFTKFFKQVPFSWRKESGYGDFIADKIVEYGTHEISSEQLRDAILNNWFDNDFVRTYYFNRKASDGKTYVPNFISYSGENRAKEFAPQYHPLILAALTVNDEGTYEPSIDANNAPRFIKIPRRGEENAKDSQRRYTIYEKINNGMKQTEDGEWVIYPIYVKVEPKGNQLRGNYLMTEYGRSDARIEERTLSREGLSKAYKLGDFISRQTIEDMKNKFGENWATIIESMNYYNMFDQKYNQNIANFNKAVSKNSGKNNIPNSVISNYDGNWSRTQVATDTDNLYIFTDNTDRDSGKTLIDPNSKYAKKYGADKHYPTMTQAVVRGLDNAMPISTQHWYHNGAKGESGRWTDDAFDEFKATIDAEFDDILTEWNTGKYKKIIFGNQDGLFNAKISNISKERTPKIYQYLKDKLEWFNQQVNGTTDQVQLSQEEQKEAEEIKKICKGGK